MPDRKAEPLTPDEIERTRELATNGARDLPYPRTYEDYERHTLIWLATLDAEREAHAQTAAELEVERTFLRGLDDLQNRCRWEDIAAALDVWEHKRSNTDNPGADTLRAYVERAADKVSDVHVKAIEDVRSILVDLSPEPLLMKDTRRLAREYVAEVDTLRAELGRVEAERDEALKRGCTFAQHTVGDGCQHCQAQETIARLAEERDAAEAERDEALAKVETLRGALRPLADYVGETLADSLDSPGTRRTLTTLNEIAEEALDATAPDAPSILDAVRAEAWDEGRAKVLGHIEERTHHESGTHSALLRQVARVVREQHNPYRARTTDATDPEGGSDAE